MLAGLVDEVRAEVEEVMDPETGLTFGQMRMIKDVKEIEPGVVRVDFIPSSPFCPIAFKLALDIKKAAERVKGVRRVYVYCHGHMMEDAINRMVNEGGVEG